MFRRAEQSKKIKREKRKIGLNKTIRQKDKNGRTENEALKSEQKKGKNKKGTKKNGEVKQEEELIARIKKQERLQV